MVARYVSTQEKPINIRRGEGGGVGKGGPLWSPTVVRLPLRLMPIGGPLWPPAGDPTEQAMALPQIPDRIHE
jgi:hypothetical protein